MVFFVVTQTYPTDLTDLTYPPSGVSPRGVT
jgi:hypothetical protein